MFNTGVDEFLTEISKVFGRISPMERVDPGLENALAQVFCAKISTQLKDLRRALKNFQQTNFLVFGTNQFRNRFFLFSFINIDYTFICKVIYLRVFVFPYGKQRKD